MNVFYSGRVVGFYWCFGEIEGKCGVEIVKVSYLFCKWGLCFVIVEYVCVFVVLGKCCLEV